MEGVRLRILQNRSVQTEKVHCVLNVVNGRPRPRHIPENFQKTKKAEKLFLEMRIDLK